MTSTRKTAIVIGALFLVATATYIAGSALITAAKSPDNLANLNQTQVRIGVLLEFVDAAAAVAIGILLLSTLRAFSEELAFAYAASRIAEAVLIMVSALGALLLIPLSDRYAQAVASNASQLQDLALLVTKSYDLAFQLAMIALGAGSIGLCYVLYRAKLVPRALAALGIVGYVCLFVSGWLVIFGSDLGVLLFAPGAAFEIFFPVWLIVKGFSHRATSKLDRPLEDLVPALGGSA
jgi:hypothetical protein